jgi:hypothetical protein
MASPGNPLSGQQPSPPEGYKLDVTPPAGYALDQNVPESPQSIPPPAADPVAQSPEVPPQTMHPVLQQVLKENPGLAQNFNADNTSLVFASGERKQRGLKERGGLEFWHPEGEPIDKGGDPTYPTPQLGKNVLEVYSDDLKNDPIALKQALVGDLLHGMTSDPRWKNLRDQFMQNFTPQERKRQKEAQTWWEDVNGDRHAEQKGEVGHSLGNGTYDAYIRGWIFNEGEGRQGQTEQGNTMYSPKQLQILQKMQEYLKTGKISTAPLKNTHSTPEKIVTKKEPIRPEPDWDANDYKRNGLKVPPSLAVPNK